MAWVRRFVFVDRPRHNKFWQICVSGNVCYVDFGRVGTEGARQVKSFPYEKDAEKFAEARIREKQRKGYTEVSSILPDNLQPPAPVDLPKPGGKVPPGKPQRRMDM